VEKAYEKIEDQSEYGFGLWARFMIQHPKDFGGFQENEVVNVARALSDRTISPSQGARTLLIQMTEDSYVFGTYDLETNNPSISEELDLDQSIEGEWTFLYFSYSAE
jgi:hypothetical protein